MCCAGEPVAIRVSPEMAQHFAPVAQLALSLAPEAMSVIRLACCPREGDVGRSDRGPRRGGACPSVDRAAARQLYQTLGQWLG